MTQEMRDRLQKIQDIRDLGVNPYPERFVRTHGCGDFATMVEKNPELVKESETIVEGKPKTYTIAGRLMMFRSMGKLAFGVLQDDSGRMQVAFMQNLLGKESFQFVEKKVDVADFIGVSGELFRTKHGELTLLVTEYTFLGKALRPLPEKFHGIKDQETLYRKRYLDLIMNPDTKKRFQFRSDFVRALREFYWSKGFTEVETPILCNAASGALASPFKTHHNALDTDVYLRIAPETYLKEVVVGGFEKVFELGRVFRNEGIDPSHLQDFTMLEHYAAYWNYEDNMAFTEELFLFVLDRVVGSRVVSIKDKEGEMHEVDFTPPWPRVTLRDLILKDSGIDIHLCDTVEKLREAIQEKGIMVEDMMKLGRGNLIDHLYKKVSRPKLRQPTFITEHPLDLSPLARKNDTQGTVVDRFQLVINTWEVVNAYSELVDPVDQMERFEKQSALKDAGDADAHMKDDDYVTAMEHGMPPISGWGMGVDRILALLTGQDNLRDVVLFPLMRPESGGEEEKSAE